jgi:HCOMODA/2-hydroxy-3-carboxy-muconic semialdehyde decarboxylase
VVPFTLTTAKLRCCIHPACALGTGVAVWDIRSRFGDTEMLVRGLEQGRDLARALGSGPVALLRGHGSVVAAPNLKQAIVTAIHLKANARVQSEAMRMGEVEFLTEGDITCTAERADSDKAPTRMWDYRARRAQRRS